MNKIKGFDGIRGLAVIAVLLTHLHFYNMLEFHHLMTPAIKSLINGTAGVQAFFILSGFLITMLLINEFKKTGVISIRNFFIRRTLRIFPLYILFLLISTILFLIDQNVTNLKSLAFSYLYIYNFIPREAYTSFLGHTWSLAVEEHFYLIWPFVFVILNRYELMTRIWVLFATILLAQFLYLSLLQLNLDSKFFVERWSFIAGYNIVLGCLISILIHSVQFGKTLSILLTRKALFIALIVYVSSSFIYVEQADFLQVLTSLIRSIGISIVVLYVYVNQSSKLVNLLENRALSYIGLISYGIYMYQGLFLATGPERTPGILWPPNQTIGFILLVIVSPLSYHFFEKPFIKLKDRLQQKRHNIGN